MTVYSFTGYEGSDLYGNTLTSGDQFNIANEDAITIILSDDDLAVDGDASSNETSSDATGDQLAFISDDSDTVLVDGVEFYLESTFEFTIAGDTTVYTGYHFETEGASSVEFTILPNDLPAGTATVTSVDSDPSPDSIDYASLASSDEVIDDSIFTNLDLSGDDEIVGGDGDDIIFGDTGNDVISGGDGDDIILGDATTESSDYSGIDDPSGNGTTIDNNDDVSDGVTAGDGDIELSITFVEADTTSAVVYNTNTTQYTEGLNNGDDVDNNYFRFSGQGAGETTTAQLDFTSTSSTLSDEVENVNFRLNDIDAGINSWQDGVTILAYNADGDQVEVVLTAGSGITLTDEDSGALGNDTATAIEGSSTNSGSATGSLLVEIAGPVSQVVFIYSNEEDNFQVMDMTEVFYDTITVEDTTSSTGYDDIIDGGDGDDLIRGNLGDDTLDGGTGSDTIYGGDGADTIDGGADDDTIDGGADDDTIDGGTGDDEIWISSGADTIDGGDGADTYTAFGDTSLSDETIDVVVDDGGNGTVAKTNDASTDTVTSIETFIADEASEESDTITLTAEDLTASDVTGIDDTATGFFTPGDGSGAIAFGGTGEPTISELLDGTYTPSSGVSISLGGDYTITGGDESGQIGDIAFENFETINFSVVCFADGTRIKTPNGLRLIESLKVGDLVETLDNGPQPIRWVGNKKLSAATLSSQPHLRPICIKMGALGPDTPICDLIVSPQHRILVKSKIAVRMFDCSEVFVPAKALLPLDGVEILDDVQNVTYFHIMCDQHEIIEADGALAETLYTGTEALKAMSPQAILEISQVFGDQPFMNPPHARFVPKGKLAKKLVDRHVSNNKFICSA